MGVALVEGRSYGICCLLSHYTFTAILDSGVWKKSGGAPPNGKPINILQFRLTAVAHVSDKRFCAERLTTFRCTIYNMYIRRPVNTNATTPAQQRTLIVCSSQGGGLH